MRRRPTAKDKQCGGGKSFRRRGGRGKRGIADPVTFRRLLAERSKLVKNDDAEQSDGGVERYAKPQTQRYRIFHCVPHVPAFEALR